MSGFDANAQTAFWEDTSNGNQIWEVPLAGGAATLFSALPSSIAGDGIVADTSYVYAGSGDPVNGRGVTAARANVCPCPAEENLSLTTNGAAQTILVSSSDGGLSGTPNMLFGDGSSVYACDYARGVLTRQSATGGAVQMLTATCGYNYGFDQANVYWRGPAPASTTPIHSTSLASGGDVTIATVQGEAYLLSSNGSDLVIIASAAPANAPDSLSVVPVSGGTPASVYTFPTDRTALIATTDASFAYVLEATNEVSDASLVRIPLAGGPPAVLGTQMFADAEGAYFAMTADSFVWVDTDSVPYTVWKINLH